MLENFSISGFRNFSHLAIPRLGRVNLVVGKNNVGKSTLLEAIWLYSCGVRPECIYSLLLGRQEIRQEFDSDTREIEVELRSLFYGRMSDENATKEIRFGVRNQPELEVAVRFVWVERIESSEPYPAAFAEVREGQVSLVDGDVYQALAVSVGSQPAFYVRRDSSWSRALRRARSNRYELGPPLLRIGGAEGETVGRWWDAVGLLDSEKRVIDCLNLLAPITGIKLIENPNRFRERIVVVKLLGEPLPQPLKSLGGGVERVFQTMLALEYARLALRESQGRLFADLPPKNLLLIDEVEAGIHYSALTDYWQMLLRLAQERDVQIVATTHSWDCIQSFQQATMLNHGCDGMLIRLEKRKESVYPVLFDEKELAIATREHIEVR